MNTADALKACEETVRRLDPDRYFASLFVPAQTRPHVFALYAFNCEVASAGERVREPMMGAVRLQWWREVLSEAREGNPRAHPAAIGLAEMFARAAPPMSEFEVLLDAREFDLSGETFPDLAALETYCDATSASLLRIVASLQGADHEEFLRHAGIAYAITGLLRAIPFHAARRKLYLPLSILIAQGMTAEDVFAGRHGSALTRTVHMLAACARDHLRALRAIRARGPAAVSVLPVSVAPLYLRQLERTSFNPHRDTSDVPLYRRQLALLKAATFGRF